MTGVRVALLPDFPEERWPSMDLCAEMLHAHWPAGVGPLTRTVPPFAWLAGRLPGVGQRKVAANADRLFNRFVAYPRFARLLADRFDAFHVADHSYAALVAALPAGRAGVTVFDLDAFGCLLDPHANPRPHWFRALTRRVLAGVRQAGVVFVASRTVGEQLRRTGLIDPARLRYAPVGVAPEFTPHGGAEVPPWLSALRGRPWVAHVGSGVPRKRIDVLLEVFARLRLQHPDLHLVKVGGEFTAAHRALIARHGLSGAITHVHGLSRGELAAVYRAAPAVLQPSAAEGFGLPVVEALACGAAVVASDIPVLREVGGDAVAFAPVGDLDAWAAAVHGVLTRPRPPAERAAALAWAGQFTWTRHADTVADAYRDLVGDRCG